MYGYTNEDLFCTPIVPIVIDFSNKCNYMNDNREEEDASAKTNQNHRARAA